ncbi:MAG: AMP-binding protein, partial [bacterium]|nr:AMP-binding protein [bacterium]
ENKNILETIPIGTPINNTSIYICDNEMNLKPIGIPGELVIAGISLARGYANRPGLTAEKFQKADNSWFRTHSKKHAEKCSTKNRNPEPGDCFYRSGDLARWLPDGNIEFLGRVDHQVKIRGFRIEIGEIENTLLNMVEIKEAIVIARTESAGEKYLCAYCVPAVSGAKLDMETVKDTMMLNLPAYMIPTNFISIQKIPLTANGKVDQKALPAPDALKREEHYLPPTNNIEAKLVVIWADVLDMKKNIIGINDNFFKLGGHSLKAAVMIAKVHKAMDVKIPISQIFNLETIKKMATYIKEAQKDTFISIKPAEKKEYYPQTSAQKRLFILQQMETESMAYNTQLLDLHYIRVEKTKFENALKRLIKRHDSLRTSFHMLEEKAVQKVHDSMDFHLEWYESREGRGRNTDPPMVDNQHPPEDRRKEQPQRYAVERELPGVPVDELVKGFVRPFELAAAPLVRVGLINLRNVKQVLMLDMHHIITDGVSMTIFMRELRELYDGKELPPQKLQYRDFAQWVDGETEASSLKKQEAFWLGEFSAEIPVMALPTDHPRPAVLSFKGHTIYFRIDAEETEQLKKQVYAENATLYMLLLSAFNVLLARLSGHEDLVVGTVTAGRRHADLQDIIGIFVNTIALRNYPKGEKTVKEFLVEVEERALVAFENQDYQFEELVKKVVLQRDAGRNPLFDISFGLENEFERTGYLAKVLLPGETGPYSFNEDTAMFDLTVIATETGDQISFSFEYNTKLFEKTTILRFTGYFKKLLTSICSNIDETISHIAIIPEEEKNRILYDFNDTDRESPHNKTIHELFQQQVERTPDHIALVGISKDAGRTALTYGQLNRESGKLAKLLNQKGVVPNSIAALIVSRTIEMGIGIMGILKAGGAYLPVEPEYPQDRINYMLKDSCAGHLVTLYGFKEKIDFHNEPIYLDNFDEFGELRELKESREIKELKTAGSRQPKTSVQHPEPGTQPASGLAYIIYTS